MLYPGVLNNEAVNVREIYTAITISIVLISMIGVSTAIDGGELDLGVQTIEDWHNATYFYSGNGGANTGSPAGIFATRIIFANIENYDDIYLMKIYASYGDYAITGTGGTFVIRNSSGYHISEGEVFAWDSGTNVQIQFEPSFWRRGSLSGGQSLYLDLYGVTIEIKTNAYQGDAPFIIAGPGGESNGHVISSEIYTQTSDYTKIERTGIVADNETCLYIQRFNLIRINPNTELATESHLHFEDNNGTVYHNSTGLTNVYNVSTVTAPLGLLIDYGEATRWYNWTGPSTCYPATPTPTPTATPTPGTDLCQYWSLSLNTSNINRNEAVLGTLTETDPEDRYDMIDWYRVLPNGQEAIARHYVYDPGLFGLGAGWFLVDSYTGYTEASSVDEALENEIQFTTGGTQYVRVRIYDDKSLLPLVYHDYDHVCTKEAIVYVGETTQSLSQQGINVYEADTNAFLSGVSLNVYDYGSGEWQNKTSTYGATTYFNAVPGHTMRVLADLAGWLSSDSSFTVSSPPVPYAVYLKRPLPDIANKSYAFFNVRDSVTHTGLYQATIQLSDGQLQSTLPSGYAGFSVNDSESYYYTVSKPGYQTLTSTFNISDDTTIPILLVQIAPTPTTTLPITTLPTVTVTGTLTPTVTGTTTLTATATGTYSNATLAPAERVQKTTKAVDVWYTNAETISNLLFLAVIVGILGLMSNAMDKRRRRR